MNLETHRTLDLLPDRSAATAATWMQAHPEIELVSRDRSAEFAKAVAEGAPQAVQVLDRFHLMQNLVEQVDVVLSRCVAQLRRALPRPTSKPDHPTPPAEWKPTPPPSILRRQDARQEARQARYEQILALRQEGCNSVEIAQHLGSDSFLVNTVYLSLALCLHVLYRLYSGKMRGKTRRIMVDPQLLDVLPCHLLHLEPKLSKLHATRRSPGC